MLDQSKFEIVPISKVPPAESVTNANGLEALLINDGQASNGSPDVLDRKAVCFEVNGLPRGHKAWIRRSDGKCQLMFEEHGGESEWLGEYSSVDHALQALSNKFV